MWLQVLLFNTNYWIEHHSFVCTQSNDSKYCYVSPTIQLNVTHLFTYNKMIKQFYLKQFNSAEVIKVKWFEELLYITNNSIKHHSFIYTLLKDQTVLFKTI